MVLHVLVFGGAVLVSSEVVARARARVCACVCVCVCVCVREREGVRARVITGEADAAATEQAVTFCLYARKRER